MIYALIIAGGAEQIGKGNVPKQFLKLRHRAIVSYAVEAFLYHEKIDKVVVMLPEEWLEHTKNLFLQDFGESEKILIGVAGQSKFESTLKGVEYITENLETDNDTIIVVHEAIRPFISKIIIDNNIKSIEKYDACSTVVPIRETIIKSDDNKTITPVSSNTILYRGQTPHTFKLKKFEECFESISIENRVQLKVPTDVFTACGEKVGLVEGDEMNINISTPYSLDIAKTLVNSIQRKGERVIV